MKLQSTTFGYISLAFLNGYYREAVADFATALERFFEFFVKTVFREWGLPDEAVANTWKLMSRQSERQLGAFSALYLYITGRVPDFLHPNRLQTSFRNEVVHKGHMPSREETVRYAETVHALIRTLLPELWEIAPRSVGRVRDDLTSELGEQAKAEGYLFSVFHFDGMFGVLRFSPDAIAMLEEYGLAYATQDYLRTDLGFEDALEARRMFIEASFYDEKKHGPQGGMFGEAKNE